MSKQSKQIEPTPQALRSGGSVTLPEGANEQEIDAALRRSTDPETDIAPEATT